MIPGATSHDIPLTIQALPWLLESAPVVSLVVLATGFDQNPRSRKLPGVVAEKFLSQLILLEFNLNRLEHATGFLRLDALLFRFKDDLRLRSSGERFHALADQLVLLRLVPDEDLGRRDIADDINPLRQSLDLPGGFLREGCLTNPEGCEVVFAHGVRNRREAALTGTECGRGGGGAKERWCSRSAVKE